MNITDAQLESILAKMLPETIAQHACGSERSCAVSDTPRTDADAAILHLQSDFGLSGYVRADFARQLERELAAVTAERDALQKEVELVIGFQDREADAKRKAFADLSASQQEARRLREALENANEKIRAFAKPAVQQLLAKMSAPVQK